MPQVKVKFFEHPIERTEEEIAELRQSGLLAEDAPVTPAAPGLPARTPPANPPAADNKETK